MDISEAIASAVDSALPPTTPDADDTEQSVAPVAEAEVAPDIDLTPDADEAADSDDAPVAEAVELPDG